MAFLLDTNTFSRFVSGRDRRLSECVFRFRRECLLSAITWYELEYGRLRSPDPVRTSSRLALMRTYFSDVQPFGEREAERAGWVRSYLEALKPNAQPIGPYDVLLAGHALELGAIFVTHNVREFSRVPGLTIEDWEAA